jgi:hypothetical protein
MPSRTITLAIVAFWLITAGWFVARDVWPHVRPGQPPPYTIELADEAMRQVVPVRWTFSRNGKEVGTIRTSLRYHEEDDSFELTAQFPELSLAGVGPVELLAREYEDKVRVSRDGELRAMHTTLKLVMKGFGPELTGRAEVVAEVRHGWLERRFRLEAPGLGTFAPELEPAEPPQGRVLNPTHPVHRITGLRPGQSWRQPVADPRADIIRVVIARLAGGDQAAPVPGAAPEALAARVLSDPRPLKYEGVEHACLVIEYRGDFQGDEFTAHTWVRQSDGLVLLQEVAAHGETLVLQRE